MKSVKEYFPILTWLPNYKKDYLKGDLSAGLTVGIMLIPQGMAYAMIAGLPPVYGLYASLLPQVVYAVFGTSRQLAVGPVAMDSLLVAAGVSTLAMVGSDQYIALAILLSLLMGGLQLLFGLARMGFLVNFLSQPVISGFTSAAALIIGLNQLQHLLGIDLQGGNMVFEIVIEAVQSFDQINWISVAIGLLGIVIIKISKKIHRNIPGALVAVFLSILMVRFFQLDQYQLKIVGEIPEGLPAFQLPAITSEYLTDLLPVALTIALIAFMEAISVAKAIQSKHKSAYTLNPNQEMIGLGMGNIVGSFFGAYPTTGGFSRSAVNDQTGARTNLAAVISAALIVLTLLFLTPLFYYLPKAILASVIMVAVFGLIDVKYPKRLWNVSKQDCLMLLVTFGITLVFGIKEGIGIGILASLVALIYRTSMPHIAVLARLSGTDEYRNVNRFSDVDTREDVLVIRQDGALYFANATYFSDTIKQHVETKGPSLKLLVLHFGSVSSIDITALQMLRELIQELNQRNVGVYFTEVVGPVRDFFHRTGFTTEVGRNHFFIDVQSAIDYLDGNARKHSKQMLERALQSNVFEEKLV